MNKYEMVYIVDSRLSEAEKADVGKQVADLVAKFGGKIIDSTVWLDRQRMAFQLDKANEGVYYLVNLNMKGSEVAQFRKELKINEKVLRFLLIRPEEQIVAA